MARRISFPVFLAAAFGVFTTVAVGTMFAYYALGERRQVTRTLGRNAEATIAAVVEHLADHMRVAAAKLDDLRTWFSQSPAVLEDDAQATLILRGALAGPRQVVAVAFVHVDGRSWRMARGPYRLVRDDLMQRKDVRELIAAARAGRLAPETTWSPPITDSVLRQTLVVARAPVVVEGKTAGLLFVAVSMEDLSTYLARISERLGRTVFILSGRSRVLAHPLLVGRRGEGAMAPISSFGDARLVRMWAPSRPMLGLDQMHLSTGHWLEQPGTGDVWVYIYRTITSYGADWIVGYHYNASVGDNRPVRDFWWGVGIGGGFLILCVLVGALLGRRLSMPIRRLAAAMSQVGTTEPENLPRLPGSRITELDSSSEAFNRLAATLKNFERYAPREVVRRLVASGERISLEKSEATILFADLDGFSGLAESWTPEQTGRFLSVYFSCLSRAIEATGGTIDKFMGDGVMACWGVPQQMEDPASAAVRCAIQLRDLVPELAAVVDNRDSSSAWIRVGIHTGEVLAGEIGSELRSGYTLIGDAVNVAARLQDVAKDFPVRPSDGGVRIAISADTMRRAGDSPPTETAGTHKVRGRDAPVEVFRA